MRRGSPYRESSTRSAAPTLVDRVDPHAAAAERPEGGRLRHSPPSVAIRVSGGAPPDAAGGRLPVGVARLGGVPCCPAGAGYFRVTVAPAASSWPLALSAVSLLTFSRTGFGAPSTRSLASFRPRLVSARTSLMTWIFLSPAASRMTSNSSCSSTSSAAAPAADWTGGRGRHRRGSGDVEGLLELLHELRELDQGHLLERVEEVVGAELRHDGGSFLACGPDRAGGCHGRARCGPAEPSSGRSGPLPEAAGAPRPRSSAVSGPSDAGGAPGGGRAWPRRLGLGRPQARPADAALRPAGRSASAEPGTALPPGGDAFIAPASLASRTSRDSRSASFLISSAESGLPSSTPPLMTRTGFARAKSRRPLAASTGSPLTNAIADGPTQEVLESPRSRLRLAAILVSVFFTTA